MTKSGVKLGRIVLGEGVPKIAVPITGRNEKDILSQAKAAVSARPDLIEWRIDFFDEVTNKEKLHDVAKLLRDDLNDIPLLTTFRTHSEGGQLELSDESYFEICQNIIDFKQTDAIDVELFHDESSIKKIVDDARLSGIVTIMSNHEFTKTPDKDVIINRLSIMGDIGADIAKMAVMPQSSTDVLTLLEATHEANKKLTLPIITMSMGDLGKISRISGELIDSCVTFATVGEASAPGQIPISRLKNDLADLHLNE
ncbi:type I 3-dehydroquinate dehydratase [Companilactobacillus mishanensis]|uniref:3-dehydroquinate dehydratase n=1 Tax=Companilactobacillus mishanensis TaxID=2486008 RepID=A0A5P0ZG97_9LACO|nr:type I 3-dehydroquinate dehydratase [Companilactobacillus mishanensis]MQS52005.1 type I 3-dehydroquinate dehydratase [Companilactobacillus mishanensis]